MFFKNKVSIDDLTSTYVGVINHIYKGFELDIDTINKLSFLLDLYCFIYFGTISNLEKLLTKKQTESFEKKILCSLLGDYYSDKIEIKKIKDFNWNFFSQQYGTLLFLQYKLLSINICIDENTLFTYGSTMLNNLNATNSYLKTITLI